MAGREKCGEGGPTHLHTSHAALAALVLAGARLAAGDLDVVLSEIHYGPLSGDPRDEYVEIHNRGPTPVDLGGFQFTEGIGLTVPAGTRLEPQGFLVVSPDPARTRAAHGIANVLDTPFTGRLDNDGEIIALRNAAGEVVSRVHYGVESIWPSRPDGLGPSLELVDPAASPDHSESWAASRVVGGTPGRPNSRLRAGPPPARVLLGTQDTWRYFKGTVEPSSPLGAWTARTFGDGGWDEAPGGFGYGGAPEFTTQIPDMVNEYGTFYIRGRFSLTAGELDEIASGRMSLSLLVRYDDAFVAYVNGVEAGRDNAGTPGTLLPRTALADASRRAQSRMSLDSLAGGVLVAGENAVAIQGLNNVINSIDFLLAAAVELGEIPEAGADSGGVELNEMKPTDASGQGFIEVYNPGEDAAAIGGHAILDSTGRRVLVPAPLSVPAGGRAVLTAAVLGFSPAIGGATYVLARPDTEIGGDVFLDGLSTRAGPPGASFGRFPDGDDDEYVLLAATAGSPNVLQALPEVVIHEIQFHPPFVPPAGGCLMRCSDARQWIELHNRGPTPVNVAGWTLSKAVTFAFPAASIPAGGHLVVASSRATFLAEHAGFDPARVAGDWQRDLAHDSDTIHLNDALGNRVDRVRYGDGRPINDEEPLDGSNDRTFVGSQWPQGAEGSGRTIELIHPRLDNRFGGAWALGPPGGTPGAANAAFNAAPFAAIDEVEHFPPIPRPSEPVLVTCRVSAVEPIQSVEALWHREGAAGSGTVLLADDGLSGDGAAGDLKFGGTLPAQADGAIVGFQVRARLAGGKVTTVPRSPPVAPYPGFDGPYFLYQVLSPVAPGPGSVSYHVVLAAADLNELEDRPEASNVLLPCTFIEIEADGEWKVRHLAGIRYRGEQTRNDDPRPYRISFASEHPFRDIKRLNLMASSVEDEIVVADLFRRAGMPYPEEWTVNLTFQGSSSIPYSRKERFDADFLERFFGGASDSGNLYRALDPAGFPDQGDLTYFGEDPTDYEPYYEKRANEEDADHTDLVELCRAFDPVETPDDVFADRIASIIDPYQWARYFALQSLVSNSDGSIQNTTGEDYFLYRVPATSGRPDAGKWLLLPWDIEESFSDPEERLFRPQLPAVRRFLLHPRFTPLYYENLATLTDGVFSRTEMRKSLLEIEAVFGPGTAAAIDDFITERISFVGREVPVDLVAGAVPSLGERIIRIGDEWSYWRGTQAPAGTQLAWTRRGYAMTDWLTGRTGIGYGDGDDATVLTDMEGSYTTIYARKSFTVPDPATVQSMTLVIDYDDGFVAYLNGDEVARRNVSGQVGVPVPPTATAGQSIEPGNAVTIDLTAFRGSLLGGENVLAFHVVNQDIDSSDLSFLPELSLTGLDTGGIGCGAVLYASGPTIHLAGRAGAYLTRSVTVAGALAAWDPVEARWSATAAIAPGENSIVVEALDGEDGLGGVTASLVITVHRIDRPFVEAAGTLSGVTRWTAAEGPYVIRQSVTIPAGSRLEIDPGVAILAHGGASIVVRGELRALGEPESPILFRSASCADPWGGISIENTGTALASPTHTLRAADLEDADPPGTAPAIAVSGSKVLVEGSSFRRFGAPAIDASDSRLEARGSTFEGTWGGVSAGGSTLTITGSTFLGTRGGADAIRASGNLSERSLIEGCRIELAEDDGIELTQASADILSNRIRGAADAAILLAGNGPLGRSTSSWNVLEGSGTGIALADGARIDEAHHDTVTGNQIGFHLLARGGAGDGGHGTFHSMIVWSNTEEAVIDSLSSAAFTFSNLAGGVWAGAGNISLDPRFADWLAGDYSLLSSSPCIGTGEAGTDMGAVPFTGPPPVFIRADFDGSGGISITDAIACLGYIFRSGTAPACADAADANDDGSVDISDAILTLLHLFRGDVTPRAPFPAAGPDPTADSLGC
jgi:hypothetical protein